jgi:hypothetical protein
MTVTGFSLYRVNTPLIFELLLQILLNINTISDPLFSQVRTYILVNSVLYTHYLCIKTREKRKNQQKTHVVFLYQLQDPNQALPQRTKQKHEKNKRVNRT